MIETAIIICCYIIWSRFRETDTRVIDLVKSSPWGRDVVLAALEPGQLLLGGRTLYRYISTPPADRIEFLPALDYYRDEIVH